jgi:hypothetical protein
MFVNTSSGRPADGYLARTKSWRRRHLTVIGATLLLTAAVAAVGLFRNLSMIETGTRVIVIALLVVMAASERLTTLMASLLATSSLFVATTGLIATAGGHPISHLTVPVALVAATVYRRPAPWVLGLAYTVVYYGVVGWWDPSLIATATSTSEAVLWTTAIVVTAMAASVAAMFGWLLDVDAEQDSRALALALAGASLRQRQAIQIHDDVIQGLVVAKYALENGEVELAAESVTDSLEAAKGLVGGLLKIEGADLAALISRDDASRLDHVAPSERERGEPRGDAGTQEEGMSKNEEGGQR